MGRVRAAVSKLVRPSLLLVALCAWFAVLGGIAVGSFLALPAPLPVTAPATDFSEGRARALLTSVPMAQPHFWNTYTLLVAQQLLFDTMQTIAAQVPYATVEKADQYPYNVWGVVRGSAANASLFLVNAHYDTQRMTPGAQDNGAGVVVVVEVFRNIVAGPRPLQSACFLLNGNEEAGFVGIQQFLNTPLGQSVAGFLNFDGREGHKSTVFRTTGGPLDTLYHQSAPWPVGSAISDDVIHYAPVTDFYELAGISGNFPPLLGFDMGYVDAPQTYHTSQDCASHMPLGALQHQGDNCLAFVRAVLAQAELPRGSGDDVPPLQRSVYFDVLGGVMVLYTRRGSLVVHSIFAVASIVLTVVFLVLSRRPLLRVVVLTGVQLLAFLLALGGAVGLSLAVNAINPLFYQGATALGFGLTGSASAVLTSLVLGVASSLGHRCCCRGPRAALAPDDWYSSQLVLLSLLLVAATPMAYFLSSSYLMLCVAFGVVVALSLRLLFAKVALLPFALAVEPTHSEDEEEQEPLVGGKATLSVQATQRDSEPLRAALLHLALWVIASAGAVMVMYNTHGGIGALVSFPEEPEFQSLLFFAFVALAAALALLTILPAIAHIGPWIVCCVALVVLVAFFIPAAALYPYNSVYHPIRIVNPTEDFAAAQFSMACAEARDFDPLREQLARLPYFAALTPVSVSRDDCRFVYPSAYQHNWTLPFRLTVSNSTVDPSFWTAELAFSPPPMCSEIRFDIAAYNVQRVYLNGQPADGVRIVNFGLAGGTAVLQFDYLGYGGLVNLRPTLSYLYSPAIVALMCPDADVMLDSYSLNLWSPTVSVALPG
jgi:hypothetical protein